LRWPRDLKKPEFCRAYLGGEKTGNPCPAGAESSTNSEAQYGRQMNQILWEAKFNTVLTIADSLIRDANKHLDLAKNDPWAIASSVGCDLNELLEESYILRDDDSGSIARILHSWLADGLTLEDDYPGWNVPQLMAAFAVYLVADAERCIDDLPEPGATTYAYGLSWRRDEIIEHCAGNIIEALEACRYGSLLVGQDITPNPQKLAELIKEHASRAGKAGAAKRHAPNAELRLWALERYKGTGPWPSANKAAHALKGEVLEHGRRIGAHLSEENAQRTIAYWIRRGSE